MSFLSADDVFEAADTAMIPDFLPQYPQVLAQCGHMHQLLIQWAQGGCQVVSFGDLAAYSTAGAQTTPLVQQLLGRDLWLGWFDIATDPPSDFEIIPRQAMTFLALALDKMKLTYEAVEETTRAAKESYATMSAAAEKRRSTAQ